MSKPFRFGLLVEGDHLTRQSLIDLVKRAEAEGYNILLGTDHLGRLASAPLLQAAAEATSLRIGTLVLNNDFRNPVILAQELATLDMLTEGRLEIGLGAGWARVEYDASAMPFDAPGRRVTRLQATVAMLKQAFSEGRIQRDADNAYATMLLEGMPQSVQRPHPPFLIGGGGPRVLKYAAREAEIVGLDPRAFREGGHDQSDVTEAAIDEKITWIREAAGDRWADLEINIIVFGVDPDYGRRDGPSPALSHPITEAEMAGSPHYLHGDTDEMIDQLIDRRERWGINYLAIKPVHMDVLAPVVARLAGT
ncbi:MAG: TIGR03621 family F420-dependent LLM class oxidoreductase [Candidatus Limnocylindrales bacterium]